MRYDPEETTKEARVLCFTNHFASFLVSYPRFTRRSLVHIILAAQPVAERERSEREAPYGLPAAPRI